MSWAKYKKKLFVFVLLISFNNLFNDLRPPFCTLITHSWINWVDMMIIGENKVGLKEKPENTRYKKKITTK